LPPAVPGGSLDAAPSTPRGHGATPASPRRCCPTAPPRPFSSSLGRCCPGHAPPLHCAALTLPLLPTPSLPRPGPFSPRCCCLCTTRLRIQQKWALEVLLVTTDLLLASLMVS
jgi:hypothetical protein